MTRRGWSAAVALVVLCAGCAGPATQASAERAPANLDLAKREVRAYVDSGRYLQDVAAVAQRATAWLEQRAAQRQPGERLALVLDLDETLFFNWPYLSRQDFGYVHEAWQRWIDDAAAPAVDPVRELYRTSRRLGIEVCFITGRHERDRASTERNLRAIGCGEFAALICKPDNASGGTGVFKTAARRRLASEGWTIVANVGDQESDLAGGFAERTFKLPNPFYLTE